MGFKIFPLAVYCGKGCFIELHVMDIFFMISVRFHFFKSLFSLQGVETPRKFLNREC